MRIESISFILSHSGIQIYFLARYGEQLVLTRLERRHLFLNLRYLVCTVDITATAGSLSSVCKFTVIDHEASKQGFNYYLISMEYYTANNLIDAGKVSKDYRVNEADRTWDVWEDAEGRFTFTGINEWIGKSFYGIGTGEQWMWYHMKVTDGTTWSGGGVSVVLDSQPIDFTDLDAHRDEYVFHMALKTTSEANILIRFEDGLHPKKGFVLGTEPVYNNTVAYDDIIGDFARDGQWQEIEIPFSKFPEGFYNTATIGGEEGVPDAVQYVFSLILGDEPDGTEIEMDAVFFYKPAK
jgi:hypothetical protein